MVRPFIRRECSGSSIRGVRNAVFITNLSQNSSAHNRLPCLSRMSSGPMTGLEPVSTVCIYHGMLHRPYKRQVMIFNGRLSPNHYHSPYLKRTRHSLAFRILSNSSIPADVEIFPLGSVGHNTLRPMCPFMR